MLAEIYYKRSINLLLGAALLALSTACASIDSRAREAPKIPFAELPRRPKALLALQNGPVVIVFEQGQRIPVLFDLDSSLLATTARPLPFEVVASRRFFLLLSPDGLARTSLDGVHFEQKRKNSFRFGFGVNRERAYVDLGLRIQAPEGVTPPAR